jgi:gamma-glutamyltranspeptidase/glutathione hydrolase
MAVDERLFLDAEGRMLPFFEVLVGGRSVGVPGVLRMLEAAHREAGRLPWARLLEPAIATAEEGFPVSPRLHALVARNPFLKDDPDAAGYFHDDDGLPLAVGARLRNPALAATLRLLARQGSRALYEGDLARALVAKVRTHPRNPGLMTLDDLSAYQPRRREAVCLPWLRFTVCGMPPPSSGGIAVGQMLGILEASGFRGLVDSRGSLDSEGVHRFSEAGRLAYADRDRHVADSDFVALPRGLLSRDYLAARAALIGDRSIGIAPSGRPAAATYPEGGTSHVSVVDGDGNAVALTTSIEFAFGSQQMVGGFLLNNQLTDFSFVEAAGPATTAEPIANRPEPGKRPRSSMAPTLVFERPDEADDAAAAATGRGPLAMVTGSPGGSFIINYVAQTLVATLQDGLDPLAAIALPRVGSRNGPTELEQGRVDPALATALKERGHAVREVELTSGIQSIVRRCAAPDQADAPEAAARPCWWIGAADPRREGTARGQ